MGTLGVVPIESLPSDTDPEVFARLVERWRTMTIGERVDLVEQMHADVELLAVIGIRARHPRMSAVEIRRELVRRRYGDELADAAYPRPVGGGGEIAPSDVLS
jgi:hypothetical protein